MPNIHYFTVNMAPFGMSNKDEVKKIFLNLSIIIFIITENSVMSGGNKFF